MANLYQDEKNLLIEMAEHHEERAAHCDVKLAQSGTNTWKARKPQPKMFNTWGRNGRRLNP